MKTQNKYNMLCGNQWKTNQLFECKQIKNQILPQRKFKIFFFSDENFDVNENSCNSDKSCCPHGFVWAKIRTGSDRP